MNEEQLRIIDDLVTNEKLCVLATTDGIEPLCSLMTLFVDHASMKFYFLTKKDTRKCKNIKSHPHVSILIERRDANWALTIQGVYSPIQTEQTEDAIKRLMLLKHPELEAFASHPDTELIRIKGTTARLVTGPEEKFETKLKNS